MRAHLLALTALRRHPRLDTAQQILDGEHLHPQVARTTGEPGGADAMVWRPERPVREERPVALTTRAVHLRVRSVNHAARSRYSASSRWLDIYSAPQHGDLPTHGAASLGRPAILAGGLCKMLHLNFGK